MSDEQQICTLVAEWMEASKAGDGEALAALMDPDITFLTPGNSPFGLDQFMVGFESFIRKVKFEGAYEIQQIEVSGNLAFCWNHLDIRMTPETGEPIVRKGHALSVLRRGGDGRWRIWRDANVIVAEKTI